MYIERDKDKLEQQVIDAAFELIRFEKSLLVNCAECNKELTALFDALGELDDYRSTRTTILD